MAGRLPPPAFDVFNGDADGLCALHQLRLAEPRDAARITGLKREIALLERVPAIAGARVTVLDISLDRNRAALERLLAAGARVQYFDHHYAGAIPAHPGLEAHIDTAPDRCTSAIVDAHLGGRFRAWAVVAAFGDNLAASAERLAAPLALERAALATLRTLGEVLNYNGYGETLADVAIHPRELYERLAPYRDPLAFARDDPIVATLEARRRAQSASGSSKSAWCALARTGTASNARSRSARRRASSVATIGSSRANASGSR
jgi:hypothetical protein